MYVFWTYTCTTASIINSWPPRLCTCYLRQQHGQSMITPTLQQTLGLSLGTVHSMGLDKCRVPHIHHHFSITQRSFPDPAKVFTLSIHVYPSLDYLSVNNPEKPTTSWGSTSLTHKSHIRDSVNNCAAGLFSER